MLQSTLPAGWGGRPPHVRAPPRGLRAAGFTPANPPRNSTSTSASISNIPSKDGSDRAKSPNPDTLIDDADADAAEESIKVDAPTFANVELTDAQRAEAILAWKVERRKKIRKESDKSSHVYCYMHRDLVKGVFYIEVARGPKTK